jgi:hypothetical protein
MDETEFWSFTLEEESAHKNTEINVRKSSIRDIFVHQIPLCVQLSHLFDRLTLNLIRQVEISL